MEPVPYVKHLSLSQQRLLGAHVICQAPHLIATASSWSLCRMSNTSDYRNSVFMEPMLYVKHLSLSQQRPHVACVICQAPQLIATASSWSLCRMSSTSDYRNRVFMVPVSHVKHLSLSQQRLHGACVIYQAPQIIATASSCSLCHMSSTSAYRNSVFMVPVSYVKHLNLSQQRLHGACVICQAPQLIATASSWCLCRMSSTSAYRNSVFMVPVSYVKHLSLSQQRPHVACVICQAPQLFATASSWSLCHILNTSAYRNSVFINLSHHWCSYICLFLFPDSNSSVKIPLPLLGTR
jgi:ubiquitin C-terminal hydrolase